MYEPSDNDFPQLKAARETILKFLQALLNWIGIEAAMIVNAIESNESEE